MYLYIKIQKKNENDYIDDNEKSKNYMDDNNFIVNIKKEENKDIYEIKINPGQSIKLPFLLHNITISFDGYHSRNIFINYPHKKRKGKNHVRKTNISRYFLLFHI